MSDNLGGVWGEMFVVTELWEDEPLHESLWSIMRDDCARKAAERNHVLTGEVSREVTWWDKGPVRLLADFPSGAQLNIPIPVQVHDAESATHVRLYAAYRTEPRLR